MVRVSFADRPWRGGAPLRDARTCYDHLAGRLGVALAESFVRDGHVRLAISDASLTESGARFIAERAVALPPGKRPLCRGCLDWSERRPHIAGRLGAALADHAFTHGWINRLSGGRALSVTPAGRAGFAREFGVIVPG